MKNDELLLKIGELINATSIEAVLGQLGEWMSGYADTAEKIVGAESDIECYNYRVAAIKLSHLAENSKKQPTGETMNGQAIFVNDDGDALFVPIPKELAAPVPGGCQCDYCKANPELTPMWDTLALPAKAKNKQGEHTWTVHMPNKAGLKMLGWRKK